MLVQTVRTRLLLYGSVLRLGEPSRNLTFAGLQCGSIICDRHKQNAELASENLLISMNFSTIDLMVSRAQRSPSWLHSAFSLTLLSRASPQIFVMCRTLTQ